MRIECKTSCILFKLLLLSRPWWFLFIMGILRLLCCCIKGQERILVYEYMTNDSLGKFISGQKSTNVKGDEELRMVMRVTSSTTKQVVIVN